MGCIRWKDSRVTLLCPTPADLVATPGHSTLFFISGPADPGAGEATYEPQ
jgi:hypothetical protein